MERKRQAFSQTELDEMWVERALQTAGMTCSARRVDMGIRGRRRWMWLSARTVCGALIIEVNR